MELPRKVLEEATDDLGGCFVSSRHSPIPKVLREAGFDGSVEIIPDFKVAVMFPSGTKLKEVKRSLEILLRDLEFRISSEMMDEGGE